MEDINDKLRRIDFLRERVSSLENFIHCIKDNSKGNYKASTLSLKIRTTKKLSILAHFNFCFGTSEKSIEIPDELNVPIRDIAERKKEKLEKELETLIAK